LALFLFVSRTSLSCVRVLSQFMTNRPRHSRAHCSTARRRRLKVGFWRSLRRPPRADAACQFLTTAQTSSTLDLAPKPMSSASFPTAPVSALARLPQSSMPWVVWLDILSGHQ
jgi:hypothetical protein